MAIIDAQQGRPLRAAAWLGVAASLKVWPLLLVVALIAGARQKRLATVGASLIPPALLTALVAAWGGLSQLAASVQEQTGRDLEIESVFAAPLAIARAVGFRPGQLEKGLSYQFVGSTAHVLALVASGATVLGVLAWLVGVRRRPGARLPFAALALVAILLASGKVLSPQYAAWALAPAAVLGGLAISVTAPRRHLLWGWLGLYLLTTQALFPFAYNSLLGGGPLGAIVLTVHSVAVIGLLVSAVKQWMQGPPGPHIGPIEEADTSTALHPEGLFADSSTLMLVDRPQTQLLGAGR